MSRSTTIIIMILILLLGACGGRLPDPEPIIKTVEVKVPVTVPCPALESLGQPPAYPDTRQAIEAAPNLLERVKLVMAGRELRAARERALNAALEACG